MPAPISRRVVAELLGTALLVAAVVGSGITGERLAGGNAALALFTNGVATGTATALFRRMFRRCPLLRIVLSPPVEPASKVSCSGRILSCACAELLVRLSS